MAGVRTEWIWIVHAPVQGRESRYYGQLDVAAEPVDAALAAAVARRLPPVAVWLSSPLTRTRTTALALKAGVDPVVVGDFNDQHYGRWQGMGFNDVFAANRTLDWSQPADIRPPEGESFADMSVRVAAGIDRLTAHYAGHTLISLAPAGAFSIAISHALDIDLATAMRIEVAPLSITRLGHREINGTAQWSVGCINFDLAA